MQEIHISMEEVKNYYAGRHFISMQEIHISMQEIRNKA